MNGDVNHLGCKNSDFAIVGSNVIHSSTSGTSLGNNISCTMSNYNDETIDGIVCYMSYRNGTNEYIVKNKKAFLYHNENSFNYNTLTAYRKINSLTIQLPSLSSTFLDVSLENNIKIKMYVQFNLNNYLIASPTLPTNKEDLLHIVTGVINNGNIIFDPYIISSTDNYYYQGSETPTTATYNIYDIKNY